MGRLSRRRLVRRLAALGLLASLALGLAPVASAATWATFGTPIATSTYGTGVEFSQPVTVDKRLARVELLLTVANAIGPTVVEVPAPSGTGPTTLDHLLDTTGDGHLLPNTPIVARWRLVAADDPTDVALGPADPGHLRRRSLHLADGVPAASSGSTGTRAAPTSAGEP